MTDDMIRMIQLAQQGFQCSQVLLLMGLEAQGKSNPDLIRSVSALAGGLGFSGDLCGALTGAACLMGLYAGKGAPEEEEDPRFNIMVGDLAAWFTGEYGLKYGGTACRAILGNDPGSRSTRCPALVLATYQKTVSLLSEYGFDLSAGRS